MNKHLFILIIVVLALLVSPVLDSRASTLEQAVSWVQHDTQGICADGSPFSFWSHDGPSDNLLIFFQGGGLCWSDYTCKPDLSDGYNDYYFSIVQPTSDPNHASTIYKTGILDPNNVNNPLKDYDMVQIPVCTGDLGIGDDALFMNDPNSLGGNDYLMYFHGAENVETVLDWVFATYEAPTNVGIMGCSAGGPSSLFHAPRIMDNYSAATNIFQISDSLALTSLTDDTLQLWNASDYQSATNDWSMEVQTVDTANAYPTRWFGAINNGLDNAQAKYEGVLQSQLSVLFDIQTGNIEQAADNYRSWTHNGIIHCISIQSNYHLYTLNGVTLQAWITSFANGAPLQSQP